MVIIMMLHWYLVLWELLDLTFEEHREQSEACVWNLCHPPNVDYTIMVKCKPSASNTQRFGFQMDALLQGSPSPHLNLRLSETSQCNYICQKGLYRCRWVKIKMRPY